MWSTWGKPTQQQLICSCEEAVWRSALSEDALGPSASSGRQQVRNLFIKRLFYPRCTWELYYRSFLPAAVEILPSLLNPSSISVYVSCFAQYFHSCKWPTVFFFFCINIHTHFTDLFFNHISQLHSHSIVLMMVFLTTGSTVFLDVISPFVPLFYVFYDLYPFVFICMLSFV